MLIPGNNPCKNLHMARKTVDIHSTLAGKWEDGTRPKDLYAQHITTAPEKYVDIIICGLTCGDRRVENGCAELCSLLSESHPELVYPHVSLFIGNISAREKMIRWEAVCTLGNLAAADHARAIAPCIPKIVVHLRDKSIVLAGHALRSLSKMAVTWPEESKNILNAFIESADAFPGNKIGFVIEAMLPLISLENLNDDIKKFVLPYAQSNVKIVAKKAAKVLKKIP